MNTKVVSELPLGGQRKFTFLAPLAPGVVPAEQGSRDAAGGGFSANGVRSNGQNNFLLNGVDNNVNVIDFINQTVLRHRPVGGSDRRNARRDERLFGANMAAAPAVLSTSVSSPVPTIFTERVFEFLQNDKFNANTWERNRAERRSPMYGRTNTEWL